MIAYTYLMMLVFVVGLPVLSVAGLYVVRRTVPPSTLREHHDVAGFILAIVGVIYAVLLAFVVLVVWEQYNDAKVVAEQEANAVVDVFRLSNGFNDKDKARVREAIRIYAESVIVNEWPKMAHGSFSDQTSRELDRLWGSCTRMNVSGAREPVLLDQVLTHMEDISDNRRLRLLASRTGVPNDMWVVLLLGAVATVSFTYYFGLEKFKAQAGMTALLTITMGLVLFLITTLNYPFSGRVGIKPEAMQHAVERLKSIENHEAGGE